MSPERQKIEAKGPEWGEIIREGAVSFLPISKRVYSVYRESFNSHIQRERSSNSDIRACMIYECSVLDNSWLNIGY